MTYSDYSDLAAAAASRVYARFGNALAATSEEDLRQEAVLALCEALPKIDDSRSVEECRGYVYRTCWGCCMNAVGAEVNAAFARSDYEPPPRPRASVGWSVEISDSSSPCPQSPDVALATLLTKGWSFKRACKQVGYSSRHAQSRALARLRARFSDTT